MLRLCLLDLMLIQKVHIDVSLFSDVRQQSLEKMSDKGRREGIGAELALMWLVQNARIDLTFPLPIKKTKQGKPYFHDENGAPLPVYFNLSHSGDYVLAGLADFPIGVDIQLAKGRIPRFPEKILSPSEYAHYETLSDEAKDFYFFECWTAKESYLKALGTGFDRRPSSFTAPKPLFSKRIGDYQLAISADPSIKKADPIRQDLPLTIMSCDDINHIFKP